jgi:DNA-binding transcriptional regulator YhcF (GntR family)
MPRPRVARSLPQLPNRSALADAGHKAERLLDLLREVALKTQKEQPQNFYSIRDVAKRFRVPLAMVSKIYRQLGREGVLSSVRGSKTTLQGSSYDRKITVRAFVGLPATISSFVTNQDYRMFFIKLRRELRLRGFAAAMLYLDHEGPLNFADRVHRYEIDTVIWFSPEAHMRQAILQIKDSGVRLVGVANGGLPIIPCRYEIHREAAIRTVLKDWRASHALGSVTIVGNRTRSAAATEQRLQLVLQEEKIQHRFLNWADEPIDKFLRTLEETGSYGIVLLSPTASAFSFRAPHKIAELLKKFRVALVDGPVNMPFTPVPPVRVDLVYVDWQLVAERIVSDLITQDAFQATTPCAFEAEAKLQVLLSDYAQRI